MQIQDSWLEGKTAFPVYYEDTDFSGYVYHANYLKFFERGREELIGRRFLQTMWQSGVHYVVARIKISYHAPARHGDVVDVLTRLKLSDSPITDVEHTAFRQEDQLKLVSASIKMVPIDGSGTITQLPDNIVQHFKSLLVAQQG